MAKSKEWSKKLREDITLHKYDTGHKKITKALFVPLDAVGSIVCTKKNKTKKNSGCQFKGENDSSTNHSFTILP